MSDTEQVETDEEFQGDEGTVRKWITQLDSSSKREEKWRKHAKRVEERYRGESYRGFDEDFIGSTHNILWSNVETLRPTLYNQTPRPDVRRRYRDSDPSGRTVSEVLNRCLSFSMDSYDFDSVVLDLILDYLVVGRAVARVKYIPSFKKEKDEQGEEYDALDYEQVQSCLVPWEDFRIGPGKTWQVVPWIAFMHRMTREELVEKYPDIGKDIPLDLSSEEIDKMAECDQDLYKRAKIWEIYDKDEKKIYFISEGYKEKPLEIIEDTLGIDGFFPTPRPLYAVDSTSSTVPVPEYDLYESQAQELDTLTSRIHHLIKGLKLRGIYDSTISEIADVLASEENKLIPANNVMQLRDSGGLDKVIWFMPIEVASKVLVNLYQQREQVKQTIYEITGLSDILRGVSDPNETAKAQEIKRQFGGKRIERRQREIQRFIRDLLRIKAQIIAQKFQPDTIIKMSGVPNVTPQDIALLKDDTMRAFRIDIETNSTIAGTEQEDQESLGKLLQAVSGFVKEVGPMVQAGVFPMEVAKKLLAGIVRRFRMGKELEEMLEMPTPPQPEKPNPEMLKLQAEQQRAQMQMQMEQQKNQSDVQLEQAKMQMEQQKAQTDAQMEQQKMQMELESEQQKMQLEIQKMQAEMQMKQQEFAQEMELEKAKAEAEMALAREKMMMEMELEKAKMECDLMCRKEEMSMKREEMSNSMGMKKYEIDNKPNDNPS